MTRSGQLYWLSVLVWSCCLCAADGALFIVDASGGGTHLRIQDAIDVASDGDDIVVAVGVYAEQLDFGGKNVRVRSSDPFDAAIVRSTIVDAGGAGRVVTFSSGEGRSAILDGLTLQRGRTAEDGGGVFCANGSSPTLRRNLIKANTVNGNGGGVYVGSGASPLLQNNTIYGNRCDSRGGGIYVEEGSPEIIGNVIDANEAGCTSGGGVYLAVGSDGLTLRGNRITRNLSRLGGGIAVSGASPLIERNYIVANIGFPRAGGVSLLGSSAVLDSNVIAGNRATIGSAIEGNLASATILYNSIVGNWATDTGNIVFLGASQSELQGNVVAFSRTGIGVQALVGASVDASYNCMFENPGGDFSGAIVEGEGHVFTDPMLASVGDWIFTGLMLDDDEEPPCAIGETRVELVALLRSDGGARGELEYRLRPDRERLSVQVTGFSPGSHAIMVSGQNVGQIMVNAGGFGLVEFDTNDGNFPPGFPDVLIGDTASVGNLATGLMDPSWTGLGDIWTGGDEHLQPISPCVNAGPVSEEGVGIGDIDGQPRVEGVRLDIGADEQAMVGDGDTDSDGDVDFADMCLFQRCALGEAGGLRLPICATLDLDGDADVDAVDWGLFVTKVTGPE